MSKQKPEMTEAEEEELRNNPVNVFQCGHPEVDWNKVKFRASSWGNLMAEPRSKKEGELGLTCQKELIKIYNLVKYGRKKQIVTRQMIKGIKAEPESIKLFSF